MNRLKAGVSDSLSGRLSDLSQSARIELSLSPPHSFDAAFLARAETSVTILPEPETYALLLAVLALTGGIALSLA